MMAHSSESDAAPGTGETIESGDGSVRLTLTRAQVQQVVGTAPRSGEITNSLSVLLTLSPEELRSAHWEERINTQEISLSAIRLLLVLACFLGEDRPLGAAEVSAALGMGKTTTWRYVRSLWLLGVLTRDDVTRKYHVS